MSFEKCSEDVFTSSMLFISEKISCCLLSYLYNAFPIDNILKKGINYECLFSINGAFFAKLSAHVRAWSVAVSRLDHQRDPGIAPLHSTGRARIIYDLIFGPNLE